MSRWSPKERIERALKRALVDLECAKDIIENVRKEIHELGD